MQNRSQSMPKIMIKSHSKSMHELVLRLFAIHVFLLQFIINWNKIHALGILGVEGDSTSNPLHWLLSDFPNLLWLPRAKLTIMLFDCLQKGTDSEISSWIMNSCLASRLGVEWGVEAWQTNWGWNSRELIVKVDTDKKRESYELQERMQQAERKSSSWTNYALTKVLKKFGW